LFSIITPIYLIKSKITIILALFIGDLTLIWHQLGVPTELSDLILLIWTSLRLVILEIWKTTLRSNGIEVLLS
jgi:hypothetical protein